MSTHGRKVYEVENPHPQKLVRELVERQGKAIQEAVDSVDCEHMGCLLDAILNKTVALTATLIMAAGKASASAIYETASEYGVAPTLEALKVIADEGREDRASDATADVVLGLAQVVDAVGPIPPEVGWWLEQIATGRVIHPAGWLREQIADVVGGS